MSTDPETIAAYDTHSHVYAARREGRSAEPGLADFVAALPKGGHILDIGCGPGDSAYRLLKQGFTVDAVDATPAMVSRAKEVGVAARLGTFDDIDGKDVYDGIWASYSLLHAPRAAMPGHLVRFRRALKPGGVFHIGLKMGEGEWRDHLGRHYTYYTEPEIRNLLTEAGFTPVAHETASGYGLDGTEYHGIWVQCRG